MRHRHPLRRGAARVQGRVTAVEGHAVVVVLRLARACRRRRRRRRRRLVRGVGGGGGLALQNAYVLAGASAPRGPQSSQSDPGAQCCALNQPRRHRTSHRSRSCHRSNSRTSRRYYRTHFGAARLSCTRMLLQSDESSHRTGCRRPHSTAASTALQVHTAIPVGIRRTGCTRAGTSYISRWSRCPHTQNAPCNQAGPTDRALPLSPMRKHRRRAQYSRRSCATSTTRGWCFQTVCHWRKMALSSRPGNSATNTQGK